MLLRPWLYRLTLNRCYDHLRAWRAPGGRLLPPVRTLPRRHDPFEQSELQRLLEAASVT